MRHLARKHNNDHRTDVYYCWTNGDKYLSGYKYPSIGIIFNLIQPNYDVVKSYPAKVMHIIVPNDFNFWGKDNEDS